MRKLLSTVSVLLAFSILTTSASAADLFNDNTKFSSGMKNVYVGSIAKAGKAPKHDKNYDEILESGGSSGDNGLNAGDSHSSDYDEIIRNAFISLYGSEEELINNTGVINREGSARGISKTNLPNPEGGTVITATDLTAYQNGTGNYPILKEGATFQDYIRWLSSQSVIVVPDELKTEYLGDTEAHVHSSTYWKATKYSSAFVDGQFSEDVTEADMLPNITISSNTLHPSIISAISGNPYYGNVFDTDKNGLLEDAYILIAEKLKGKSGFTSNVPTRNNVEKSVWEYIESCWVKPAKEYAELFIGPYRIEDVKITESYIDGELIRKYDFNSESGREATVLTKYAAEMNAAYEDYATVLKDYYDFVSGPDAEENQDDYYKDKYNEAKYHIKYDNEHPHYGQTHIQWAHNGDWTLCSGSTEESWKAWAEGQVQKEIDRLEGLKEASKKTLEEKKEEWEPYGVEKERVRAERELYCILPDLRDEIEKDFVEIKNNYEANLKAWDKYNLAMDAHKKWEEENSKYKTYLEKKTNCSNYELRQWIVKFYGPDVVEPTPPGPEPVVPEKPKKIDEPSLGELIRKKQEEMTTDDVVGMTNKSYVRYQNAVNILDGPGGNLTYSKSLASQSEYTLFSGGHCALDDKIVIDSEEKFEEYVWYYINVYGEPSFTEANQGGDHFYDETDADEPSMTELSVELDSSTTAYNYEDFKNFENWLRENDLFFYGDPDNEGPNHGYTLGPNTDNDLDYLIFTFKELNERQKPIDSHFDYLSEYRDGMDSEKFLIEVGENNTNTSIQEMTIGFLNNLGIFGGENLTPEKWLSASYYTDISVVDYSNDTQYHDGNFQRFEWYVLYNSRSNANRNDTDTMVVYHNTTTAKNCPFTPVKSGTYWIECYQSSKRSFGEHLTYNVRNFLVDETTKTVLLASMDVRRVEKIAEKLIPEKIALRYNESGIWIDEGSNVRWRVGEDGKQIILDSFTTERVDDTYFSKN